MDGIVRDPTPFICRRHALRRRRHKLRRWGVIKGTADDGCSLRHPLPARSMSTFVLNRCNDCRSTLKRRIVSSTGDAKPENYGRPFYACRRPNSFKLKGHCSYFRFADVGFESIEDWSFPTAASPPSSSTSSESFAMPLRSNRLRCVLDTCGKIANKHCDSKKCEPHCLADGGCSHKSHRLGTSKHGSTFQQSSAEPAPAPAQSSSHPTPSPPPSIPQHVQPNQDAGLTAPVTPSLARITPTTPAISPADTTRNAVAGPSRPRPAPNSATSLAPGTQGQPAPVTPTISPAAVAPNAVASSSRPRPTPKSVTPHDHPRHTSKATSGYMIDSLALMYGKQQEVRDEEAVREEQKKEQRKREKREVIVHCWHKDDKEPTADFWCEEIDEGFSIMNALRGDMKTSEAFFEGFPSASHFNKSTFSDNHERWLFAEPAAREVALRAGRTNAGRWTIFAATNPSKKSKLRTARRALAGKGGLMSLPAVDEESM